MKIIFLDIDGVLNVIRQDRDRFGRLYEDAFIANLRKIIKATGAKIVLCSSHRSDGLNHFRKMWKHRKYPGTIIDLTPSIFVKAYYYTKRSSFENYKAPRGCEIELWLSETGKFKRTYWSKEEQIAKLKKSKVKNYVILDDDADMLFTQREHYVQCSNNFKHKDSIEGYGLTERCANKAIKILNSDLIDLYY